MKEQALFDQWKHFIEELARAVTDCSGQEYEFPTEWDATSFHGASTPAQDNAPGESSDDSLSRETRERLRSVRTTVRFDETSLDDAAAFLGRISATRIDIDPVVREGRSPDELSLSLRLDTPESVDKILDLITTFRGLVWSVRDGVVTIGSSTLPPGDMVIRLYDVLDLATTVRDFPGEEVHSGGPIGEFFESEDD